MTAHLVQAPRYNNVVESFINGLPEVRYITLRLSTHQIQSQVGSIGKLRASQHREHNP